MLNEIPRTIDLDLFFLPSSLKIFWDIYKMTLLEDPYPNVDRDLSHDRKSWRHRSSTHVTESEIRNPAKSSSWNPESTITESGIQIWFGIRNPMSSESGIQRVGIRNPEGWNSEYSGSESGIQMVGTNRKYFSFTFRLCSRGCSLFIARTVKHRTNFLTSSIPNWSCLLLAKSFRSFSLIC